MSLQDFVSQYPSAAGGLSAIVARISAADTDAHSDSKLILVSATGLADAAIFLVPLLTETAGDELPAPSELLACKMLWLQLQGKTENADTSCTLVCDIIGGASFVEDKLEEGQTGVTLEGVRQVYTASTWLMGKAREAKHFTVIKPGASASATSGKDAVSSVSPATLVPSVRAQDLDGRDWSDKCADKKGVRAKLDAVQALTRLWSAARMTRYCSELVLNHERLETTCRNLKSTGKHPGVIQGAADDTDHPDYGLVKFCILQSMAVMQSGFGQGSRFQNAIYLKYSATDHTRISIADFGSPKEATTITFEVGRSTPKARSQLCRWLGGFQLFYRAFSGPAFQSPLDSLDQVPDERLFPLVPVSRYFPLVPREPVAV
jgi:hypothetical protein